MKMSNAHVRIRELITEAMETDLALPISVGPRMFGSSMPEYRHTVKERRQTVNEDYFETGGERTREDEKAERRQTERRRRCSPQRISRMERVFALVVASVPDEKHRKCLLAFAMVKARRANWSDWLMARNKRNLRKNAWTRQKTYEWIAKAYQAIEDKIMQGDESCISAADLQAGQISPENTGKSISSDSGLRAWMSPDGKPDQYRTYSQGPTAD